MKKSIYSNVGKILFNIAEVFFWIETVLFTLSGVGGCIYFVVNASGDDDYLIAIGCLAIMFLGILLSWLSNCMLAAFGQLVHNVNMIKKKMGKGE